MAEAEAERACQMLSGKSVFLHCFSGELQQHFRKTVNRDIHHDDTLSYTSEDYLNDTSQRIPQKGNFLDGTPKNSP